jgi:hypothetical protein
MSIFSSATTGKGITSSASVLTTGILYEGVITSGGITSGNILKLSESTGNTSADRSGASILITSSRTEIGAEARSDDYDLMSLSRTSVVNNAGATFNAAGSVLKLENTATETNGTLSDTTLALEIAHNTYAATDQYAVSITHDNGSTGAAGGIDLSSFSVDEPNFKFVDDAVNTPGDLVKQAAVDVGGTTYYIYLYETGTTT